MRKCKKCGIEKEINLFHHYKPGYYRHECGECRNAPRRKGGFHRGKFQKGHISILKGKKLPREQVEKSALSRRKNNGTRDCWAYKNWRKLVIERDKKCTECGSEKRLESHHIKNWKDFPDLRYELENGKTLCKSCHRKLEGFQKGYKVSIEIRKKMSETHKKKYLELKG